MRLSCHEALPNPNMLPWSTVVKNDQRAFVVSDVNLALNFLSFLSCFIVLASLHLASVWIMIKRDSSIANLESPRVLMNSPRRRQVVIEARRDRGAASSNGASSCSNANQSLGLATTSHPRHEASRSTDEPQHFGYAAMIPSVPLPSANSPGIPEEAYPLQSELSQNHRVLPHSRFQRGHSTSQFRSGQSIAMEWNVAVKRSSSSMELLAMSAHMMVDTSTVGTRPLDLPISGVGTTTFLKCMRKIRRGPHFSKIITDRLTMLKAQCRNSRNLKWKTTPRWLLKQGTCRFQVRFINWHPCFTTCSSLTGNTMPRSLRSLRSLRQIQKPTLFSCSRQAILLTFPATWQFLRRLFPNMLRIKNWMTSRRSPTRLSKSCTSTPEWVGNSNLVTGFLIP